MTLLKSVADIILLMIASIANKIIETAKRARPI